jgi:hypothetical protein
VHPLVTGEANKIIHAWRPTDIEPRVLVVGRVGIGGGRFKNSIRTVESESTQPHLNLNPH